MGALGAGIGNALSALALPALFFGRWEFFLFFDAPGALLLRGICVSACGGYTLTFRRLSLLCV